MLKAQHRRGRIERVYRDFLSLEIQRSRRRGPRVDQIPDNLILSIDRDGLTACQRAEIDAMPSSLETDIEPLVTQPGSLKPRANAHRVEQVHGTLLQDAGPDAVDDIVPAAVLDNDGIDAIEVKEMAQQQPRGAGADNSDLRPEGTHTGLRSRGGR